MSIFAPAFCMRKFRSRWKSFIICRDMREKRPGMRGRNSAPSPTLRRSMRVLASWIAPARPVSRMPVPWSFLHTLAVRPVWSWSCRKAGSLMTWFTRFPGTGTVSVSTVVMSASSSSMASLALRAESRLPSLAQMRAERASRSSVTFCSRSSFSLIFERWPMDMASTFLRITAPSSSASTSFGSSPMSTPSIASLHFLICSFVPSRRTSRRPGSSLSALRCGVMILHPVPSCRSRMFAPPRPMILPMSRSSTWMVPSSRGPA
mmetsp:Transcript_60536/g.194943  ORF Transcript_60536/g.194943 Transcript_60536/m.194943 type:complete len:262 (-) Transcript_60536:13-798(-)